MLKNINQPIGGKGWKERRMNGGKDFSSIQSSNLPSFQSSNHISILKSKEPKGFTLIELTIVIALMMILYAIATPSLRNLAPSSRLKSSAREIQSLLTYARDVAMTENVGYLVIFDLDEQQYWLISSENFDSENATSSLVTASSFATSRSQQNTSVSEEGSSEGEISSFRTAMIAGIPRKPATGVEIAAINITHDYSSSANISPDSSSNPEFNSTEVTTGTEYILFTPKGTSEDMVLYLQDKTGKMMSVRVKKETGQVSVKKESQDISQSQDFRS
ncbi:prepilin-type N-terminal cleavage/methylation domain-containing protein [Candidatus Poribacteria bacterium]|nr:prepilin-type N-terminal cleavage/methylation domain-containing protein [Candidatus Poribacteria bacterium]